MEFLKCIPAIFVIEDRYEILVHTKKNGIISVIIGDQRYYEENSGILYSEKNYAKISVPQEELNLHKKYTISFCETIEKKIHFSQLAPEQLYTFSFKPIEKTENINIYYLSDIHGDFDLAVKAANYFGDNLDLLIVNGDLCEFTTLNSYIEVANFLGKASKGIVPIVLSRGNHDTRGRYSELFTDYFPNINKKVFYQFSIGPIEGVVLDLGEDKLDSHPEYGNTNNFYDYRRKELKFIEKVEPLNSSYKIAISHICPPIYTIKTEECFHIEHELNTKFSRHLERIGIDFILSGHFHKTYFLDSYSDTAIIKVNYPIIVGTVKGENYVCGSAITLKQNEIIIKVTDNNNNVVQEKIMNIQKKTVH